MELTVPTRSGLYTKTCKQDKSPCSVVVGKKEVAMRRTPSAASTASRRGSISMLAHQLRMLEAQKEGGVFVRYVVALSCILPIFKCCPFLVVFDRTAVHM